MRGLSFGGGDRGTEGHRGPAGSSSCHCRPDLPVLLSGPELISGETPWLVSPSPSSCLLHSPTVDGPAPPCPPCPSQAPLDSHNKTWVDPCPDRCHKHVRMCVCVCPHARPLSHTSRLVQTSLQLLWPCVWPSPQQGGWFFRACCCFGPIPSSGPQSPLRPGLLALPGCLPGRWPAHPCSSA